MNCRTLHSWWKVLFPWWRHQMETFSALLALYAGNSLVTGEFPTQRPVKRGFDISMICAWVNGSVNNREANDLRRYRACHGVTIMPFILPSLYLSDADVLPAKTLCWSFYSGLNVEHSPLCELFVPDGTRIYRLLIWVGLDYCLD